MTITRPDLVKTTIIAGIISFFTPLLIHPYAFFTGNEIAQIVAKEPINISPPVSFQRAPTLNNRGYTFYIINPLAQQFIKAESTPEKTVLEIGSGFSNVALESLQRGVGSYTANDMSFDHLKMLVTRIINLLESEADPLLERLLILHATAPHELPITTNCYDAILLDKVLHFLNPAEIELFINWASKALKPGGKLYILTISPYIPTFREYALASYGEQQAAGNKYPGYTENIFSYFNKKSQPDYPLYALPYALTFFAQKDLALLFIEHGFTIKQSYAVTLPNMNDNFWRIVDEKEGELTALIVEKPY